MTIFTSSSVQERLESEGKGHHRGPVTSSFPCCSGPRRRAASFSAETSSQILGGPRWVRMLQHDVYWPHSVGARAFGTLPLSGLACPVVPARMPGGATTGDFGSIGLSIAPTLARPFTSLAPSGVEDDLSLSVVRLDHLSGSSESINGRAGAYRCQAIRVADDL